MYMVHTAWFALRFTGCSCRKSFKCLTARRYSFGKRALLGFWHGFWLTVFTAGFFFAVGADASKHFGNLSGKTPCTAYTHTYTHITTRISSHIFAFTQLIIVEDFVLMNYVADFFGQKLCAFSFKYNSFIIVYTMLLNYNKSLKYDTLVLIKACKLLCTISNAWCHHSHNMS